MIVVGNGCGGHQLPPGQVVFVRQVELLRLEVDCFRSKRRSLLVTEGRLLKFTQRLSVRLIVHGIERQRRAIGKHPSQGGSKTPLVRLVLVLDLAEVESTLVVDEAFFISGVADQPGSPLCRSTAG